MLASNSAKLCKILFCYGCLHVMFHCNTQENSHTDCFTGHTILRTIFKTQHVLKEHLALEKARDTLAYGQQKLSQKYQYLAVDINYARYSHKTSAVQRVTGQNEGCDWTT